MKLIIFAEKEVRDTTEAGDVIKQLKSIVTVNDFQVRDDAIKQEIKDKVEAK
jgi:hypothetical protein